MRARWFLLAVLATTACGTTPPALLPAPYPALRADTVREEVVAPGVRHRYLWDGQGPWAIHVLEIARGACGVEVRTVKAGGQLQGRARTSELAAEAERLWQRPTLAAVNADFFSFTPPGVPIGAQVSGGEVIRGPVSRPVFGLTTEGVPFIAVLRLEGELRSPHRFAAPVVSANVRPGVEGVAVYNRFAGARTPADTGAWALPVRILSGSQLLGDTVRAVALQGAPATDGAALPDGGAVLTGRGRGGTFLRDLVAAGDTLAWWLRLEPAPGRVREVVGGFPQLLRAGEAVHPLDPGVSRAFGETRHPRTAVGWRPDGTLLLVTVDGRQAPYSDGMSLAELAELFLRLGATDALNLDGGGSTAMVVRGAVVNRPSDATGERPNANALVVLGPAGDRCPPAAGRPLITPSRQRRR
jgi:hypothetical protein